MSQNRDEPQKIKCLVWDLDNTLWDGILLEERAVAPRAEAVKLIKSLDERGILQSIASKNDFDTAWSRLKDFGLDQFFLFPWIGWGSKVPAIRSVARDLNIGTDTIAFIDDEPFEREEVSFALPEVLCLDPANLGQILSLPRMTPRFVTADARDRRRMIQMDHLRKREEEIFQGTGEEFLASLEMVMTIFPARESDLQRAEELTRRTNQMNTTGYTYSYDELNIFRTSDRHLLLMAGLEDRFGKYGLVGLTLVTCAPECWTINLLLTSCRVISRGIGSIMLTHLKRQALQNHVGLRAEFIATGVNRMMEITYRLAGFTEIEETGSPALMECGLSTEPKFPDYIRVKL